jgi:hypothetical protein
MQAEAGTVHQPFLYDASGAQLQEFLLLGLFVAGKGAIVQQHKLHWFLELMHVRVYPHGNFYIFERINRVGDAELEKFLRFVGAGQYRRLVPALRWLATETSKGRLNLHTCTRDDLTACPGIGLKTASFFLIYTRKDATYACLDTHILRWLREECGYAEAPLTSPTSKRQYTHWENIYLEEARKGGWDPTELDLHLWLTYSRKI